MSLINQRKASSSTNSNTKALKYNETPGTITQKPGVPWGKVVWN